MDFKIKHLDDAYNFEDLFKIYPNVVMYTPGESLSDTQISTILASTSYNDQIENINSMLKDINLGDINKIISITGFIKPTADRNDKSILNVIDYNKIELSGGEPTRTSNIGKDYLKAFYSELYRARKDDDLNFLNAISDNIILNASALYDNVDEKISLNDNVTAYRCIAGFLNRSTTFSKATGGKVINTILSNQQNGIVNTASEYANTIADSNIKYIERAISGCATIKIKFLDGDTSSGVIDAIVNEINGSGLNIMQAWRHPYRDDTIYFGPFSTIEKINNRTVATFSNVDGRYFYFSKRSQISGTTPPQYEFKNNLFYRNGDIHCKIYVNLNSCTNISNAFGFGYTTTETTPGYIMFRVNKNFLNNSNALKAYAGCIDGNWIDVAKCFSIIQQREANRKNTFSNLISVSRYPAANGVYSSFITGDGFTISKTVSYKDLKGDDATEFRIAQYYNPGNILGFFAETNEPSIGTNIYAVGYSRVDYQIPFMLSKKYIRALNNGHYLWYFYVPFDNQTNKDALIEYQGFKLVVPDVIGAAGDYQLKVYNVSYSDTFYENNMVNGIPTTYLDSKVCLCR